MTSESQFKRARKKEKKKCKKGLKWLNKELLVALSNKQ